MTSSFIYDAAFVKSIFHPSDFSAASENAFAHALAFSFLRSTQLTILHAGGSAKDWRLFPAVRETLQRWGLLEEGSQKNQVFEELSVRVKKVKVRNDNPVPATLEYLAEHPTDLIVLATEGRDGLQKWLKPSMAERIALKSESKTLFVPNKSRGFVSRSSGEISLRRILVPVASHPSPLPALEYAARAAQITAEETAIRLFYVGEADDMPVMSMPEAPGVRLEIESRPGAVVAEILIEAGKAVDLIVMSTAGHEGFLDALRGSVTEQVLRHCSCPLLAVPTT